MTAQEKAQIAAMRHTGLSYKEIAESLQMTASKVKTYCTRNCLGGARAPVGRKHSETGKCEQCGKAVAQQAGRKHKRFCSDACRMAWWAAHRSMVKQKTVRQFVCAECGAAFDAYGVKERSYCSRACYSHARRKQVQA